MALYVDARHGLYTRWIFREHVSVAYLRACVRDVEALREARPEVFDGEVRRAWRERRGRRRRAEVAWLRGRKGEVGGS